MRLACFRSSTARTELQPNHLARTAPVMGLPAMHYGAPLFVGAIGYSARRSNDLETIMISPRLRETLIREYVPPSTRQSKAHQLAERFPDSYGYVLNPGIVLNTNVVFIDICSFSRTTEGMSPRDLKQYLDRFYRIVIPAIYGRGGEIEKVLGDGVVAVFGPPFGGFGAAALREGLATAIDFSRDMISRLAFSDMPVKCALRQGELCFTAIGDQHYHEPNVVGHTLTELARLESVAVPQALSTFAGTVEQELAAAVLGQALSHEWSAGIREVSLPGVSYSVIHYREFVGHPRTTTAPDREHSHA